MSLAEVFTTAGRIEFAILAVIQANELGETLDLPKQPEDYFTLFHRKDVPGTGV